MKSVKYVAIHFIFYPSDFGERMHIELGKRKVVIPHSVIQNSGYVCYLCHGLYFFEDSLRLAKCARKIAVNGADGEIACIAT